jgi:hypothetical protein
LFFTDGGEYEVDECYVKRIYDTATATYLNLWIGGIIERSSGRLYLCRLADRSVSSCIPLVTDHVMIGQILYTDCYPSYNQLRDLDCLHYSVNHSKKEYARLDQLPDGDEIKVSINAMEGIFCHVRSRLKHKTRRNFESLDLFLSEMMFRKSGEDLVQV